MTATQQLRATYRKASFEKLVTDLLAYRKIEKPTEDDRRLGRVLIAELRKRL